MLALGVTLAGTILGGLAWMSESQAKHVPERLERIESVLEEVRRVQAVHGERIAHIEGLLSAGSE